MAREYTAKSIEVLSGLDPVKKRPGMYTETSRPNHLALEVIDNSIDEEFLFYSLISLNNKEWKNIHPEHLRLILNGYLQYNDGVIFRDIILEIFKNYKFII